MADNSLKFRYHSNYRPDSAFQSVRFGYDTPILETELNEMQIIQEEARKSLIRQMVPSGFIELVQREFSGPSIVYNPVYKASTKLNHIALAPARAIVNGTEVILDGNFQYDSYKNYILINLGEAPETGVREDLVYLEVWFETLSGYDTVPKNGYIFGNNLGNLMIDQRVADETNRRIVLRWDIRIANNIKFDVFPEGFGYNNVNKYSQIYGTANGQLGYEYNPNLIFRNAGDDIFKGCQFYRDNNLWVAGRPDYYFKSSTLFGNYIFALPLFRVKRRNKSQYSISNFNGARNYVFLSSEKNSSYSGDLANHLRPDGLYYDYIAEQDLVDLRRTISVSELNSDYYLTKGLNHLFTGKMQTKDTKQMRRIQFGKEKIDYSTSKIALLVATFNNQTPEPTNIENVVQSGYTTEGTTLKYKDSLGGYGLFLDGNSSIKYSASSINVDEGTIEFFMQPYWNGYDNDVSQTFLSLWDTNGNPIFNFQKKGQKLIWNQYTDVVGPGLDGTINQVIVDLTNKLLFARNTYHIRLSWINTTTINRSFIYINGKLASDNTYSGCKLLPSKLQIGKIEDLGKDTGIVMEELVVYKVAFEQVVRTGTYSYIDNVYWPGLPEDFISSNALLYPSFNSAVRNFEDNGCIQSGVITKLQTAVSGSGEFILKPHIDKTIIGIPKVYALSGDDNTDYIINELTGTWSIIDGNGYFTADDTTFDEIIVQYDIEIKPGNGGVDIPNEMLAAGIINGDTISEVSFARKNTTEPRNVKIYNPGKVSAAIDTAYDFSTSRDRYQCFARLLYYHKSGDGTNYYEIPAKLYGYEVIGIIEVTNRQIVKLTRVEQTATSNGRYIIVLKDNVLLGDVLQIKVVLGGMTFDYETQTKSLVSNIHKTKMVELIANGLTNEFVIPCYDVGSYNGGIVKSVFTFYDNQFTTINNQKVFVEQIKKHACYINNEMFPLLPDRGEDGNLTGTYSNQLAEFTVDDSSFGTPFLKIKFKLTPPQDSRIVIPVLVSYQPSDNEVLSIWYNHIPYQGILSNTKKNLKRISDWKYFVTTLGSGSLALDIDEMNIYSLNNIINRLPGGSAFAYIVDGQKIKLNHLADSLEDDSNPQLFFIKDIIYASNNNQLDNSFFELDTDISISRVTSGFQDERLILSGNDFKVYFPGCKEDITKYTGMACLVMDENGQLLIFVIGCLNNNDISGIKSKQIYIKPIYGDIFKVPGLPSTIRQY